MAKKTTITIIQLVFLMARPLSLLSVTGFFAVLIPAVCYRAMWIKNIMKTCPALPMSAFFQIVVAPPSHITPFSSSVTRYTHMITPTPAHTEFRLGHGLRFIGVKAAVNFPVLTADGID